MRINRDKLQEMLRSNQEKDFVYESLKTFLFNPQNSNKVMIRYLQDTGVLEGDENETSFVYNKKSCQVVKENEWDYNGFSNIGTHKDWKQTLITEFNKISSKIHEEDPENGGGADCIVINKSSEFILQQLDYVSFYQSVIKKGVYEEIGILGNRYRILSTPHEKIVDKNEIVIGNTNEKGNLSNSLIGKVYIQEFPDRIPSF